MVRLEKQGGFTAIELSIVVVIIGFLVAGILFAQDMIRQARIQSVVTDIKNFRSAISVFREQYNDLPGDITDGFEHWGTDCAASETLCSGDGDYNIEVSDAAADSNEQMRAWQHLALSGLIPGAYTGVDAGTPDVQISVNAPTSKIEGGGYLLVDTTVYSSTDNLIAFGAENNNAVEGSIITPLEAWQIDDKMDDGIAAEGNTLTLNGNGDTGCLDLSATPDEYDQDNDVVACRMFFTIAN